jgi:hypothetical protein
MVVGERGDEVVAVVVAGVLSKVDAFMACRLGGGDEVFG